MRRFIGWRQVRLGEFVLGHRDEDGVVAGRELPLLRNGTFMVWRKLEQDVALFRRWIRELARGDPEEEDWLRAKIVGRWPNGDSLVRSPDGHDPGSGRNRFRYGRDLDGRRCPVGAHVRRAYPRDALGWRTERTKRSRLIRRGMPYGRPLHEGATDADDEERGLIFVCLNASIARQFELVQGQWLGDGDAFGLGNARDVLVAQPHPAGRMIVQGSPPRFLSPRGNSSGPEAGSTSSSRAWKPSEPWPRLRPRPSRRSGGRGPARRCRPSPCGSSARADGRAAGRAPPSAAASQRIARVALTRARSASEPAGRSRPPSPTAPASSCAIPSNSSRASAARSGSFMVSASSIVSCRSAKRSL